MDFAISDRMNEILARVRTIVDEEIIPLESQVMGRYFFAADGAIDNVRKVVKAAGLWGPQIPTDLGGMGLSLLEFGMVGAELGRSPLGHYCFGCQAPDSGNIELLHKYGSDEQKRRYLVPLAAGEIRSCFSMTEPDSPGSNPVVLTCTAVADGDDYVINGHKWFTSSAEGSTFAIVMAVTNPDAPKHMRATQIIVPTDTPGFELVRNVPVMGHAGKGYGSHGEVRYNACRVPQENRIGPEGAGFLLAQERLGPGRIHHCMRWIGICERSFELMCRRALERDMGDDKPLAAKQIVRAWIAECRAAINAARLSVLHAAWTIDNKGFSAAREEVSLIKFQVAEVLGQVIDRAIQVHGALGLTDDVILSYFYAHERGARIYDGPDEVHKMVVARRILGRMQESAR